MCGICGIVHFDPSRAADPDEIRTMARPLTPRGPDDEGIWTSGAAGLGARRLSILDLEHGHQPLSNEDGTVWAVLNGEIFNYPELRRSLEGRGHRFRTRTDTEILVHLYEERGEDLVRELRGMFAVAIYDVPHRRLLLARDRVGKKPLYVWEPPGRLLFASELKSFCALRDFRRTIHRPALNAYLSFEHVPSPASIFDGVRQLEPAEVDVVDPSGIRRRRYWRPRFDPVEETSVIDRVRDILSRSVRSRLLSDVPLGLFLSGGVDSSSVAAAAAAHSSSRLKSFSIGFDDPAFDESAHARRVAEALGTDHRSLILSLRDLLDLVPVVAGFLDEPLADASILPTFALCRFARTEVKVALSGDGGDEVFLGYPTFPAERAARALSALLAPAAPVLRNLPRLLPVRHGYWPLRTKLQRFLRGLGRDPFLRQLLWIGSFAPEEVPLLLSAKSETAVPRPEVDANASPMDRAFWFYFRCYLGDGVLTKVDRASMAASLEVRSPLLDDDLIDFLTRVPERVRLPGCRTKALLRGAADPRLPSDVFRRRKQGFAVPMARWLCSELRTLAADLLSPSRLRAQGLFRPAAVHRLLQEHWNLREDHHRKLWTLLSFQLWYDRWMLPRSA